MRTPTDRLWSTPKFFVIALLVELVVTLTLNGVLNMVLELNVSSVALGIPASLVLVALLPRWRWFALRMQRPRQP